MEEGVSMRSTGLLGYLPEGGGREGKKSGWGCLVSSAAVLSRLLHVWHASCRGGAQRLLRFLTPAARAAVSGCEAEGDGRLAVARPLSPLTS